MAIEYPFGFVALCLALWFVLFFSRERVLRVTLVVSLGVHGALFVGWSRSSESRTRAQRAGDPIAFTFVQGVDEAGEGSRVALVDLPKLPPGPRTPDTVTPPIGVGAVAGAGTATKREEPPIRIEPSLPRIEPISAQWFAEHPKGESYRLRLQGLIQQHLDVPAELAERGYEGRQKVWLTIRRDGSLLSCYIDGQFMSENVLVNETSLRTVRESAKEFPPLPEGVRDHDVLFYVILDYKNLGRE